MKSPRQYISSEQEQIDKAICKLSYTYNILTQITPTNALQECQIFVEKKGQYNPQFIYKQYDRSKIQNLIQQLEQIHVLDQDPISKLQTVKIQELIEKYKLMIAYIDQDLDAIYNYNTALFGTIPRDTTIPIPKHGTQITISDYLQTHDYDSIQRITPQQAEYLVHTRCKELGVQDYKVEHKQLGSGLMAVHFESPVKILINTRDSFDTHKFVATLCHEVDGHVMRHIHGLQSGIHLFANGTGYYKIIEEGVASYHKARIEGIPSAYQHLTQMREKCKRAMTVDRTQLCTWIQQERNVSIEKSFRLALRVKQGIQDTNIIHPGTVYQFDRIYVEGRHLVDEYIEKKGSIENLMIGKITIRDLDIVA